MNLPIIKPGLVDMMANTYPLIHEDNTAFIVLKELKTIEKDNKELYVYLMDVAETKNIQPIHIEMYLRGCVMMYKILRNQAEADELNEQWEE